MVFGKKKVVDYNKLSTDLHKKINGKLEMHSKVKVSNKVDLSIAYSPGIAGPCLAIQKNPDLVRDLVMNGKTVAVITDGSAVLGLGDIGPKASLPVMEGKCVLFKRFSGLNAFPIALNTQNVDEFVKTVEMLAPSFGGINLEDISAPRCFEIEERLKKSLDIPVFHDDQHGTAIVVLAGIINSLKLLKKDKAKVKVVMNGAGAGGIATVKLLHLYGIKNIVVCDSKGIISKDRKDLNSTKVELLKIINKDNLSGSLLDALVDCDIFIGLSKGNLLGEKEIKPMNKDPVVFALANPTPEISPPLAKKLGVKIIGTGRSDFPNQINNSLVFPGIFKGAIDYRAKGITDDMKIGAAKALAALVKKPTFDKVIPGPFDKGVCTAVSESVKKYV